MEPRAFSIEINLSVPVRTDRPLITLRWLPVPGDKIDFHPVTGLHDKTGREVGRVVGGVGVGPTIQRIVASAAIEGVVSEPPIESVVSPFAEEWVDAAHAEQRIDAVTAIQGVRAAIAGKLVVESGSDQAFHRDIGVAGGIAGIHGRGVHAGAVTLPSPLRRTRCRNQGCRHRVGRLPRRR